MSRHIKAKKLKHLYLFCLKRFDKKKREDEFWKERKMGNLKKRWKNMWKFKRARKFFFLLQKLCFSWRSPNSVVLIRSFFPHLSDLPNTFLGSNPPPPSPLLPQFRKLFFSIESWFWKEEDEEKKAFVFVFPKDDLVVVYKIFVFANLSISIPRHFAAAIGCQAVPRQQAHANHLLQGLENFQVWFLMLRQE